MKNKVLAVFVIGIIVLAGGSFAFAKDSAYGSQGQAQVQSQTEVQTQNEGGQVQVQVESQNQVQTQNESGNGGDASGTQMQTQDRNQIKSANEIKNENGIEATSSENGSSSDSNMEQVEPTQMAEQVRSDVANAVQALLGVSNRVGGIGQEIKVVAQSQNENQVKIQDSINKIESKNGFAKFFFGPDYGEINNAQTVLEQNKAQVEQLNQIKAKVSSTADQQALGQQINALVQANAQIQTTLNQQEQTFSLFGWIFKMFSK